VLQYVAVCSVVMRFNVAVCFSVLQCAQLQMIFAVDTREGMCSVSTRVGM